MAIVTNEKVSGLITVTTAGTEVQGPDVVGQGWFIRAKAANTGLVFVGNDGAGAVASTSGYSLSAGDQVYIEVPNLAMLWFDSAVNGEGFCWLKAVAASAIR
jgi:hypothetical protein